MFGDSFSRPGSQSYDDNTARYSSGFGAGMNGGPIRQNVASFSERERAYYQHLLSIADPDGSGTVQASTGASLLQRSGLPQDTLRNIWAVADVGGEGWLGTEAFFVALRLVAHAQAGRDVSTTSVGREPDALPEFNGVPVPDRTRGFSGSQPPSTDGSLGSTCASAFTSVRSSQAPKWQLSQRDKRKYARLFLQTDENGDGFVEAFEARSVCERSGLDDSVLALAWSHADRDRDGRLTFQEFTCLMHIVSCRIRGAEVPSLEQGLPGDFSASVAAIHESARTLAAQGRGGSRSPSSASRSSRSASLSPSPRAGGFDGSMSASQQFSLESPTRAAVSQQLKQRQLESPQFGGGSSPWTTASSHSGTAPRFGDERSPRDVQADVAAVGRHLSCVLRADRLVAQLLRSEADRLEVEVRQLADEGRVLEQHARREREEGQELQDVQHQFERQLFESRQRLGSLQEERRALGSGALLRRDREPFAEELKLLAQAAEDEGQVLEELHRSNTYLEDAQRAMREETEDLEATFRRISEESSKEKTVLRREELLTADIRQLLEHSGRTPPRSSSQGAPRSMQAPGRPPASEAGSHFSEPLSWASSLLVSGEPTGAAPAAASRPLRGDRAATRPADREGV